MSSSPHDYLLSARACMSADASEAHYRATSSRAYYSGLHAGKEALSALPSIGSVGAANGVHEQTIALLRDPSGNTKKVKKFSVALGNLLMASRTIRVKADYDPEGDFEKHLALDSLDIAEQLLMGKQELLDTIEKQRDKRHAAEESTPEA